jgi:poly-gamma-glutamate synthesis protein (capsule biosynthesis protein)
MTKSNKLKIACIGDVMCGDSFYTLGQGVASALDRFGKKFLQDEIVDVFHNHDLVLCNVECVLSDIDRKENSLRRLHMRGRPQAAEHLAHWGITVAHTANNHILEQGLGAAVDTVQKLQSAGIKTVGAGKNGCFQSGIEAINVALGKQLVTIVGACFHKGKYAFTSNLNEVLTSIETEANKENLVIVSVHWGDELMDRPSIWQKQAAQEFISAGASLVIGHHPHVVQGIGMVNRGLVAYSLGNFIFDSFLDDCAWSIVLSVTISDKTIVDWEYLPIKKNSDHRPSIATGKYKEDIQKEVERRCKLLNGEFPPQQYTDKYKSEFQTLDAQARRTLRREILRQILDIKPVYWPQILWRPIQRRVGKW